MTAINDYWAALDRLIRNKPNVVPIGRPINNDTVALEAGRKRGSIKKSRTVFHELITAIEQASENATFKEDQVSKVRNILRGERVQKQNYRELYHMALNRELMLIERLTQIEKKLLKYDNVISIV
jgi:hypothetical protein